jgi:long-chain acyl-CoA synthetase
MFDFLRFGKKPAIIAESGEVVSYEFIHAFAAQFGSMLDQQGLMILKASNSPGSILIYAAAISQKVPVLLIDSDTTDEEFSEIVNVYKPKYIASPLGSSIVSGFVNLLSELDYRIDLNDSNYTIAIHSDLALLLTTSGSTGSKKYVKISHDNIRENTVAISKYLDMSSSDVCITMLPMSYTYGLSVINTHLFSGASILTTKLTVMSRQFWELIDQYRITSLSGVPYLYQMMIKIGFLKRDLAHVRLITQAGGHLPEKDKIRLVDYCAKEDIRFFVMYGQTEATSRMSFLSPDRVREKINSIGKPIAGGAFEILVEGNLVDSANVTGELVFRGPSVSMGYSNGYTDLASGESLNGVLHTGDLGYKDNEGFYYIVGRSKRFAKVCGLRVSLDEIENLVREIAPLLEIACLEKAEKLLIFYVGSSDTKDISIELSKRTKLNSMAFVFQKVDEIPRSSSGKIRYSDL